MSMSGEKHLSRRPGEQSPDTDETDLASSLDELPLWSAPFGLLLLETVRLRKDCVALDIGCGTGFPLIELAQRLGPTCKVYGIDPWETAVARAREKIAAWGIESAHVILGKAEQLPLGNGSIDLIVSNNGISNTQDPQQVFAECYRVCRASAQLVMTYNLPETMREFYGVFEETLRALSLADRIGEMKKHIHAKRMPLDEMKGLLSRSGFRIMNVVLDSFTLRYADGTTMLAHSLIRNGFREPWQDILGEEERSRFFGKLEANLNKYSQRHGELALTIPFACIDCVKE